MRKIRAVNNVDESEADKDGHGRGQKRDDSGLAPSLLLFDFGIGCRGAAIRAAFRPAADIPTAVFTGHERSLKAPFPLHVALRFRGADDEPGAAFMTAQRSGHNRRVFNILDGVARGATVFYLFHLRSPFYSDSASLLSPLSDENFSLETCGLFLRINISVR